MGTLTDWHSSILPILETSPAHPALPPSSLPQLAASWRAGFFEEIQARFDTGLPDEDIDVTHRRVLDRLLEGMGVGFGEEGEMGWNDEIRRRAVGGWHVMHGE
jgi:hypothetical protein